MNSFVSSIRKTGAIDNLCDTHILNHKSATLTGHLDKNILKSWWLEGHILIVFFPSKWQAPTHRARAAGPPTTLAPWGIERKLPLYTWLHSYAIQSNIKSSLLILESDSSQTPYEELKRVGYKCLFSFYIYRSPLHHPILFPNAWIHRLIANSIHDYRELDIGVCGLHINFPSKGLITWMTSMSGVLHELYTLQIIHSLSPQCKIYPALTEVILKSAQFANMNETYWYGLQ